MTTTILDQVSRTAACLLLLASPAILSAQTDQLHTSEAHLRGGEFGLAARAIESLPNRQADAVLAQISSAQAVGGDPTSAGATMRGIESPKARQSASQDVQNGHGGNSFADFQSLIDLIQTTVVPDTWEALGGPSTMAPYPQGVFVDPNGTLKECKTVDSKDRLSDIAASLLSLDPSVDPSNQLMTPDAWLQSAKRRCVSLRRLRDVVAQQRIAGRPIELSMRHLAGLSNVRYVVFTENDIILVGQVGGIETKQGWYRDRKTARNTLRFDFLTTCIRSASEGRPFGCTIDPTTEGLQRAASVSAGIHDNSIPIGQAAVRMQEALGQQNIEVFGTAGDTAIGYLMVEADRHMKQLALGEQPMPEGVHSYLDVVQAMIDIGAPSDLLLRLWFTAQQRHVRSDADKRVFEIAGTPIQLSGQNERALASGQRGFVVVDPRTKVFTEEFNRNWSRIAQMYPVYGSLESIYELASIAELISKYGDPIHQQLAQSLALSIGDDPWMLPVPKRVESIAVLHSFRHGRQRHHLVIASGGVSVKPAATLSPNVAKYPSLGSQSMTSRDKPKIVQRWWWDTLHSPRK